MGSFRGFYDYVVKFIHLIYFTGNYPIALVDRALAGGKRKKVKTPFTMGVELCGGYIYVTFELTMNQKKENINLIDLIADSCCSPTLSHTIRTFRTFVINLMLEAWNSCWVLGLNFRLVLQQQQEVNSWQWEINFKKTCKKKCWVVGWLTYDLIWLPHHTHTLSWTVKGKWTEAAYSCYHFTEGSWINEYIISNILQWSWWTRFMAHIS